MREMFKANAIKNGVQILGETDNTLTIVSKDGQLVTTYHFDENGNFAFITH